MISEYKDMSKLLEGDKGAMAFYNTLPISLQQKLYRSGVDSFAELYSAAGRSTGAAAKLPEGYNAASVSEYTGAVPEGTGEGTGLLKAD